MADSFIDSEVAAQELRNRELIAAIESEGADLQAKRQIDFFFYTIERADADALAADLLAAGFSAAQVGDEPYEGKWPVQGELNASVNEITDLAFVERMVRLAAKYLAEFDGWGTAL
jgi:regulator of RNase E activity RraB